ncbi:MAG: 16S rRNA (guanine(527)-N(7))-methyltransferase RsmG [Afipia sp.]|nr:16S rRNA (guanine(527)-N(7))-methyltransferase RsmG [Afipia sp.]
MPPLPSDRETALLLTPVSRETAERLDRFVALLAEWQAKTNLIASSELPKIWTRHVADSLQLLRLAPSAKRWLDFGSGGGFPGVVLACALADKENARIDLVERNARKAAFLREALRITKSPGAVHPTSIEDYVDRSNAPADCVTARAVAPLHLLIGFVEPFLKDGAKALFPKGQDVEAELTDATKYWTIDHTLHPSLTGNGWIVEINSIAKR